MPYRFSRQPNPSLAIFLTAALFTAQTIDAASNLPSGGTFVAGVGNISSAGNILTINQNSLKGIIDWNTFSIGQGAAVNFKNGSGATLNRVTGSTPTSIFGQLSATGSIYLLNPEGVLIGHGAVVHTGGDFLATTLNLPNSFFLHNNFQFTGNSLATVVNLGDIASSGGNIYLIGRTVQNGGSITSANGTSGLAAGTQVLIADSSTSQKVAVQAPGGDVTNSGFINAAQVELQSNGGNIYALAGNNGGQINATGTATQNGRVWLIATNGTTNVSSQISASNANGAGGAIETSGAHVSTNGAQIKTGKGGNWLLDPDDLTIDSTLAGTIETSLNAGTNVTEQTTAGGIGGSGDITVASNIAWFGGANLTLSAYRNIGVNNGVTISNNGSGNLTLRADNSSTGIGTVSFTGNGHVDFSAGTGNVSILYNPFNGQANKYNNPTNYSSNVLTNGSWTNPGDGSANTQLTSYMLVNNVTDLQNISTNLAGTYGLGVNIDASSASNFAYLGNSDTPFSGIFDGQGHLISNLSITSNDQYAGLFGKNTGTIRNVGLMNVAVTDYGNSFIGGLAGLNQGTIFASFSNGQISGSNIAGGLVGQNANGTINDTYAGGAVFAPTTGGLVGQNTQTGSPATINSSYSTAIAGGGLVGLNSGGSATYSYWDTNNSGTFNSALGGGINRSTLQEALPTGFSGSVWGGGGAFGLYPYLLWQIPASTTPVPIFGYTYTDQTHGTSIINTAVKAIVNGSNLGQTIFTGADGYYNFLTNSSTGAFGGGVVTYLPQQGNSAAFYNNFSNTSPLPITLGYFTMSGLATTFSAVVANLNTAVGSVVVPNNLPFSVTGGGTLSLRSGTNLDLITYGGALSLNQALTVNSLVLEGNWTVTQTQPIDVTDLSLLGPQKYTLTNSGNLIDVLATNLTRNVFSNPTIVQNPLSLAQAIQPLAAANSGINLFSGSNLHLGTTDAATGIYTTTKATIVTSQGLTVDSGITVRANSSGAALVLADGTTFTNNASSSTLYTPNGTWQVWSQNPANDNRGGEAYNFKQYNATYGVTTPAQATGNGFFYTLAPTLNATFADVTKQYDTTPNAAINTDSYSLSGAIDGDTVAIANAPSAGTFADKNAGPIKTVTVTGITATGTALSGTANVYGYTVNPAHNVESTITQAPVTIITSAANKVYDGTTTAAGSATLSGVLEGDVVNITPGATYNFNNPNAGTTKPVTASGLTIGGADATNYAVSVEGTTANVTPATLTYTANPASQTYGAANNVFSGSVTGFVNGQTLATATTGSAVFTSPTTAASNVGSYAISGSGLAANNGNYTFFQAEGNPAALTINPATLTYTANPASQTYGTGNNMFSGSVAGFVNGQTLATATTGSAVFTSPTTAASNVGSYAINGSGLTANNGNYTFVQAEDNPSALTINPATLTYTAAGGATQTYGSSNNVFSGTVTGLVNGQTLAAATTGSAVFTSPTTAASNVGTYAINGSGLTANNGNYTFVQAEGNPSALTINPATLTYSANPASQTYGVGNNVFSGTVTGLVNGQTLATATTGSAAFTSSTTAASNVGTYAINGSGLTANNGNYTFVQAEDNPSALTINPATLTYAATGGATQTYGSSNTVFSGTVTGFVNGQTLATATTGGAAFTSPTTAASNVGTYAINGSGLAANNGNYVFAQASGNASALTINPAVLTYVADPVTQASGSSNTSFTGSVIGFVNGQTQPSATTGVAVFASAATASSPSGLYAINGSGLTANNGNYVFTQAAGNAAALTITAGSVPPPTSPTTITIDINSATSLLGQTPTFTATYVGSPVNGLNIGSLLAGLTYQITPAVNGAGTYQITATGTSPAGYTLNFVPGTLTLLDNSPATLPTQTRLFVPDTPILIPVLGAGSQSGLLAPANSLGLFQILTTATPVGGTSTPTVLFTTPDSPQPPLAQFSYFGTADGQKDAFVAGAKP